MLSSLTVCRHSQPFLSVSGNVYPKHGRRSASVNRWFRLQRVSSIWSARRKYFSRYENPPDSPPPGRSSYCDADLGTCRVQVILSSHWSAWGNTELWLVQAGRSLRPSSSLASLRAPRSDDWSVSSTRSVSNYTFNIYCSSSTLKHFHKTLQYSLYYEIFMSCKSYASL